MPYKYSNKKIFYSKLLESFVSLVLFPFKKSETENVEEVKSILLVEPFQMGDVLSLTPLIAPLKKKYFNAKIYLLTKPSSGGVLKFDSRVSEVLTTDFPWSDYGVKSNKLSRIISSLKFVFVLRKYSFDIGIDTRGDIRSQIIMLLSGCKKRVGYTNYLHSNINLKGSLLTNKISESKLMHRYEWNLDLLKTLDFSQDDLFPVKFPCFIPDKLNSVEKSKSKNIVVHIGGGWKYKRWDEKKWIELIDRLSLNINQEVFVIAGSGEKDIVDRIKVQISERKNLLFKVTSFEELIQYIYNCDKFIGLDSGPMNLAVCMDKSVVSLFGPGDSTMWYPLNSSSKFIHKKEKFPCNPCLQTACIYPERSCMMSIEVEEVVELLN